MFSFLKKKRPNRPILFFGARQEGGPFGTHDVGTLLLEFYRAWVLHVCTDDAEKLRKALDNLDIYWLEKPIDLPSSKSKIFGECISPTRINVWQGPKLRSHYRVTRTALIHQLVHVALWTLRGDPNWRSGGSEFGDYNDWMTEYGKVIKTATEETHRQGF